MQLASVDAELVEDHLSSKACYCVVPIDPDGACYFAVIDVDIYGDDQVRQQMLDMIYASELPLVPIRSKSGGLQITAYFDPPVPAILAQNRMTRIAGSLELDLSRVEIFPKQTELRNADDPMTADRGSAACPSSCRMGLERGLRFGVSGLFV